MSTPESFSSRDELLGGLPAKRASMLLFLIESHTAHLVEQGKQAAALYLTYSGVEERVRGFLEAVARVRDVSTTVTIQDIERYAPQWAFLLPESLNANLNAALANLLQQKYRFTPQSSRNIRAVLQLDHVQVQQSYQRLYGKPLDSIYARQVRFGDRARWAWSALSARLESLPPFWLAFALTLPGGSGLLAVPIALAPVGPLAGVVFLIVVGLLNVLTAVALAEAVSRSATMRFGLGYLGQFVSEYLGHTGSLFLTLTLALNIFLVLIVFYLGIAGTLADASGLPTSLWIVAVFVAGLYFLSRKSLNMTIAVTLIVVAINVTLLLIIPLLVLPHIQPVNFNTPLSNNQSFDPTALRLIFGVMLTNYFAHLLIANYGRVVLRRDPSARAWIWGIVAAMGATVLISCLWVIAINGSVSPQVLTQQAGTVLTPLAALVGPIVNLLGSILVILSLGIATIHNSLGMYYLIQERLPVRTSGLFGERGRFVIGLIPLLGVFLLAEWFAITNSGSFAGLLSLSGVITLSLLGGIFPVLLFAATRRKGDLVPGVVYRWIGNPVLLIVAFLLFLAAIFAHGLFIWESLAERIVTIVIGLLVLSATLVMLRRGILTPRAVVELCDDQSGDGSSRFAITACGEPTRARVELNYTGGTREFDAVAGEIPTFAALESARFHLPDTPARELKVWVHQLTAEGGSKGLPAQLTLRGNGADRTQTVADGQALLSLSGGARQVEIGLVSCARVLETKDQSEKPNKNTTQV